MIILIIFLNERVWNLVGPWAAAFAWTIANGSWEWQEARGRWVDRRVEGEEKTHFRSLND